MTDRDRLIELKRQAINYAQEKADERGGLVCIDDEVDYLLANGVIVPPCKVRDELYAIFNNKVVKGIAKAVEIVIEENKISYIVGLQFFKGIMIIKGFTFGVNIFLTKEEAEEKLRKRSEENVNL